jgi:hypothetical protein
MMNSLKMLNLFFVLHYSQKIYEEGYCPFDRFWIR